MFKQLIEVWKGEETLIDEIANDFQEMLHIGQDMYNTITGVILEGKEVEDLKKTLYKRDAKLNMLEQTIRRKIVSQLVASGSEGPIASCLILMSISKDAERVGDYVKNIYQVVEIKNKIEKEEPFYGRLLQISDSVASLFKGVIEAYRDSDAGKAKELVEQSYQAQRLCDDNLKDLLLAQQGGDHVAYAVLSRYYKRSLAHLANIATSIFMPVTKIDFFDEIRAK